MKKIEVEQVSFLYTGVPVLHNLTISFEPGATAIIGENGAGKTTFMKLLNGLLKPTSGSVTVCGLNTKEHPTSKLAQHVGIVFQNPDDQIFKSKVMDEIMFGPLTIGMDVELARTYSEKAIEEMDLVGLEEMNPFDLSYSHRKRIGIASILAMNTDVVIFDEPTIGQDHVAIERIGHTIMRLVDEGKTVLAIAHDMNFVSRYFTRVIVMAKGRIIADGPPEEVFRNEEVLQEARVSAPSLVQLAAGIGLNSTPFTVEQFVQYYHKEKQSQKEM